MADSHPDTGADGKRYRLTDKQEHFAQIVAKGGTTLTEAYRQAYNAQNIKPKALWERSSILRSSPKVSTRIAELQAQTERDNAVTRDEIVSVLRSAIDRASKSDNDAAAAAAMANAADKLARICGLDAPQRSEIEYTITDDPVSVDDWERAAQDHLDS